MQLHELQRNTPNKKARRVGRGGKRGKTSGRGMKGQKARAGRKLRPEMRDVIAKIPKHRGYKFASIKSKPLTVNLATLEKVFTDGEIVNPETLSDKGVVRMRGDKKQPVKILGTGAVTKKLSVEGCALSASAKAKIEQAGGDVAEQ